jgi:CSLREA domain-containing protein
VSRSLPHAIVYALVVTALAPAFASAATYQVTTTTDSSSGSCLPASCTLRQAVNTVNGGSGGDVINVPTGAYSLVNGELSLQKAVTVSGAGPAVTRILGNGSSRVFSIPSAGVTATIEGVAVENGRLFGTGATQAHGGGIFNAGTLMLNRVLVRGNRVQPADNTGSIPEGGGIFNAATLHVANSTITDNEATTLPFSGGIPEGGGVANESGQIDITDSTLSANKTVGNAIPEGAGLNSIGGSAHGSAVTLVRVRVEGNQAIDTGGGGVPNGGGIWVFRTDLTVRESAVVGNSATGGAIAEGAGIVFAREGNLLVDQSLIANNEATGNPIAAGGGLAVRGETTEKLQVVNSTVTGNGATGGSDANGGGIENSGAAPLVVASSTISGNTVSGPLEAKGGNLYDGGFSGSLLNLRDSIVSTGAGESGAENCGGSGVQSSGHNIDSLDQCNFHAAGDRLRTDPRLGPLAANGGATETQALLADSPAIDTGDAACPPTDQRGVSRPQGGGCDIGAFERVPAPVVVPPAAAPKPSSSSSSVAALRLAHRAKLSLATGKGGVRATCLNIPSDSCAVALKLLLPGVGPKAPKAAGSARGKRLLQVGVVRGILAGGKTGKLAIKLSRKGLAVLAGRANHKLAVTASGKSTNLAGEATTIKASLSLQGKAPRRK